MNGAQVGQLSRLISDALWLDGVFWKLVVDVVARGDHELESLVIRVQAATAPKTQLRSF